MKDIRLFVTKLLPKRLLLFYKDKRFEMRGRRNQRHYEGNNVLCPCCGKTFNRFMDFDESDKYGYNKENCKNLKCPYCFSYPRHRIVCHYLNKMNMLPTSILMFGAEYSIRKWFDRKGYRYTTADISEPTADIKVDIQNTPFPDETWDLIICNHVLEHVEDYKKSLKELKRILKKDGILELTVPLDKSFET